MAVIVGPYNQISQLQHVEANSSITGTVKLTDAYTAANGYAISANLIANLASKSNTNLTDGLNVQGGVFSVNTDIIPAANNSYNLGTANNRWGDIYLSNSTIYLGNTTISETGITSSGDPMAISGGNTVITGTLDVTGDVTIEGDLTVNGSVTYIESNELNIGDNNIVLNADHSGTPTQNSGITVNRGTSANAVFQWNESSDRWEMYVPAANTYGDVAFTANVSTLAATAYANAVTQSSVHAATAYSNAYNDATTTASADATSKSDTAYSNAITYSSANAQSKADTAYSNAIIYSSANAQSKADTAYSNAVSYTQSVANTTQTNYESYSTNRSANAYANATSYADALILDSVTNTSIAYAASANAAKTAYDNGDTAYSNAVTYSTGYTDGKIATANTAMAANAATAYSNATAYADALILDSVTNTSIAYAASANAAKTAYDNGTTRAATAYSNAVSYTDGKIATANTAMAANAATAYSNAVNYTDSAIATANSAITGNAATAYSNSVTYTDSAIATANSAITGNAATAYSNSVSYTDGKIATANSAITGNAATAYSNSVSYTNSKIATANTAMAANAATAYSNAVSYTDGKIATANSAITGNAATAYSNAVSYAASIAGTAYSNATSYTDTAINNLVDSAPGALDTLNELAAALGDDPNFATTVTNNLAGKLGANATVTLTGAVTGTGTFSGNAVSFSTTATSDPTLTLAGDLTGSATFTNLGNATLTAAVVNDSHTHDGRYYTETESDNRFVNVTGDTMSGNLIITAVDAATSILQVGKSTNGSQGTGAIEVTQDGSYGGGISYNGDGSPGFVSGETADHVTFYRLNANTRSEVFHYAYSSDTVNFNGSITLGGTVDGRDVAADGTKLDGIESGATADQTASEILTLIKTVDGAGSGLDADVLDGISSASFLRSDAADSFSGKLTWSGGTADAILINSGGHIVLTNGNIKGVNQLQINDPGEGILFQGTNNVELFAVDDANDNIMNFSGAAELQRNGNKVWDAANDGAGSGLDADLLDGLQPSTSSTASTIVARDGSGDVYQRYGFSSYFNMSHGTGTRSSDTIFYSSTDNYIRKTNSTGMRASLNVPTRTGGDASGTWSISITGSAGTLDGIDSSQFLRSDASDTASQRISFTNCATNNHDAINTSTGSLGAFEIYNDLVGGDAFQAFHVGGDYALYFGLDGGINDIAVGGWSMGANSYRVWHSGNDGAGSGLDADNLDGYTWGSTNRSIESSDIYTNGWLRNRTASTGLYSQYHATHWYADSASYWNTSMGSQTAGGIRFRQGHASTIRGYVYANSSSQIGFLNSSGSWSLKVDNSGNVTATGNVTAYSDERLKTDIETISSALDKVMQLRGVNYTKDGEYQMGVIAQEVEKVIPEVVDIVDTSTLEQPDAIKDLRTVSYGNMVGLLIEAIKEQQAQIDELKALVANK
ncbi:MAG: hypothetical protein EBY41_00020 [Proteobacteria bacterium]|nr:hypothetical protein [Pseudomonadota bacterium]